MVENEQESVDDAPAVIEAHGKDEDEDEDEERAGNEDTGEGEDAEKQQEKEISVDVDEEIYDAKKEKIEDEDINKEAIIETEVYVDPSVNPASNNIDNGDDRKESDEPLVAVDSLEPSEVVASQGEKEKEERPQEQALIFRSLLNINPGSILITNINMMTPCM